VKYIPGSLQTLKFAWVQYICLAIPILAIFFAMSGFVFRHQIIETAVTSDLRPRKRV